MKDLEGGSVTSPLGFTAAGVRCGLKEKGLDIALIYSELPAVSAGVFTTNTFKAPSVIVSSERVRYPIARAIVANSGNANACTGERGIRDARKVTELAGQALSIDADEVLVASTGIIGRHLPMDRIDSGISDAAGSLCTDGGATAAEAIITTDTRAKSAAVSFEIGGRKVTIGGMAKGAGMINPCMATMLAFITTDAAIDKDLLQSCLVRAVERSFNSLTIDGDMSTNDTVLMLANAAAGNPSITSLGPDLDTFQSALNNLTLTLAKEIARDGEGATKFVEIRVNSAVTHSDARTVAKAIANSPLVKTAIFGQDPNWGRVLAAAGKSSIVFEPDQVSLLFGDVKLVESGEPLEIPAEQARKPMLEKDLVITLDLGAGEESATVFTCDMTYDYIRINAEYHT